jgi:hypothetical protein
LQQLIDNNQQTSAAAQKLQASADQAQSTASDAQKSAAEAQRLADQASANAVEAKTALAVVSNESKDENKRITALSDFVTRFRFNGDVRVRGESYFQDYPAFFNRNRARIRARFGFDGKLNEDFTAGIYLATGSLGDPTTSNETLTNFFDRKTVGIDRAFITYNPVAHPWIQLTGGKFAYTRTRTSLTFDPDVNPEGFSQRFSWDLKNHVLKNFTVGGMQLLYNEVTAGTDSYALGGFSSAKIQFGPWTASPSFTALKWNNPSALLQASAFAVQATKSGNTTSGSINVPGEGPGCAGGLAGTSPLPSNPPCAFAANGFTNAVYTDPATKLPRLLSGFFYTDFILNNQVKTGIGRLPLNVVLEYEDNLDSAAHPLDSKGVLISSLGNQGRAYLGDISLGQVKNKHDFQFGYSYHRIEQDAILASFAESDQRAPTNILQHRFYFLYKLQSNTQAGFTWWHGRTLNTNLENNAALIGKTITTAGQTEPYLNRLQFDLIYTF